MTSERGPSAATERRALDGAFLRGMGVVTLYVAIASVLRLGQDAAIAWRFGTGPAVDAYYFLVSVANWPVAVALSLLTLLIAPIDARLRSGDPAARRSFRAELLGWVLAVATLSLPLTWWALHAIAGSALGGLAPHTAILAREGAPGLALMVPLGLVAALLSAWLVAMGRNIVTLLEGLPALVLVLLVLLVPGTVLFWGTSLGFAIQLLAMVVVLRLAGELPAPSLGRASGHWRSFSDGALVLLAAQVLFALVPLVDAFFAARLGEGSIASISYTNRLVLGLQGLAGLGLLRTGLPLMSSLSVDSPAATRRVALRWAVAMGALGAVAGGVVALLADPLVSLLYERGNFTAADREQCATLLRYGMLQMPVFLASMALSTALASASARHALAAVTGINLLVKVLASALLVPWLGAPGLMIATAVMYAVSVGTAWIALRRYRGLPEPPAGA